MAKAQSASKASLPLTKYETLLIALPEIAKEEVETFLQKSGQTLIKHGANLLRTTEWGKRKMAYDIRKHSEGYYILLEFEAKGETVRRFSEFLNLQDNVLRHMTTLKKDPAKLSPAIRAE